MYHETWLTQLTLVEFHAVKTERRMEKSKAKNERKLQVHFSRQIHCLTSIFKSSSRGASNSMLSNQEQAWMSRTLYVYTSVSHNCYMPCLVLSNIPAESCWLKLAHSCFDSLDICLFDKPRQDVYFCCEEWLLSTSWMMINAKRMTPKEIICARLCEVEKTLAEWITVKLFQVSLQYKLSRKLSCSVKK